MNEVRLILSLEVVSDDAPECDGLRVAVRHLLAVHHRTEVVAQRVHDDGPGVLDVEHGLPADLTTEILEHQSILVDDSLRGELSARLQHDLGRVAALGEVLAIHIPTRV